MRWMGLVVALLLWVGCEQAVAAAPFEPIALHTVKLPADVARASEPDWIPGTDDLVFAYFPRGSEVEQVATARRDGSRLKCITCGIATGRGVQKPFAFDDGKRVLVRSNLEGAEVSQWTWSVAECAPSLARCRRRSLKPVQAVGTPATAGELQIREMRIAPDGRHVAYSLIRPDGEAMVIATLAEDGDHYVLGDPRVVNPRGALDTAQGLVDATTFYEIKKFAAGGRKLLYLAYEDAGNPDVIELDLRTGVRQRITHDTEWDEDVDRSPDGRSLFLWSTRGMGRVAGFSQVSRPAFLDGALTAHVGRVSLTPVTRKCALEPWLVDGGDGSTYRGQPVAPDPGGGWDARTPGGWNADGTALVFWQTRTRPATQSRIRIADLPARRAAKPVAAVAVPSMPWAPALGQYTGLAPTDANYVVAGPYGGSATVTVTGSLVSGTRTITYNGFGWQPGDRLDGTESLQNTLLSSAARYSADVRLSGRHTGSMTGAIEFAKTTATGHIRSGLDGHTASAPAPDTCTLPRRSSLELSMRKRSGGRLQVTVRARVLGHAEPVRGATVSTLGHRVTTNAAGVAVLPRGSARGQLVTASAGDTFKPVRRRAPRG